MKEPLRLGLCGKPNGQTGGFSLVELLIVGAIMSILLALVLPSYGVVKQRVQGISCMNNQRQIGQAMLMYAAEHGGFPYSSHFDYQCDWGEHLIPYMIPAGLLKPGEPWAKGMYQWNNGSFIHIDRNVSQGIGNNQGWPYFTCPSGPKITGNFIKYLHNYSCNEMLMPNNYSANYYDNDGNGLQQYGTLDSPLPLVKPENLERPGSLILICDGGIFDPSFSWAQGDAPDTLYGPNSVLNGDWGNPATASTASTRGALQVITPSDSDLGPGAGWPVYVRHGGFCNALMADGHVQSFRNGEMLRRNFASKAKTVRWGVSGKPVGVIDVYYP